MKNLTKKEAAERLGISVQTLDRWVRAGKIGALKVGQTTRFTEKHISDFEKKHEVKPVA